MKIWKKDLAYFFILLLSMFQIYHTFCRAFSEVRIKQNIETANVFFLPFENYIYMIAGLLLTGFSIYLYMNMSSYIVGKLLTLYLTLICIAICFAATDYHSIFLSGYIGILLMISNVFLYYLVGYLVIAVKEKYFTCITIIFILTSIIAIGFYFVCARTEKLRWLQGHIMISDYIVTLAAIIINMLHGYRRSTIYSQKQAKFLLSGILTGSILFVVMQLAPVFAIINIPEQQAEWGYDIVAYPQIMIENPGLYKTIYPIGILIGIVVTTTYTLIKREYIFMNGDKNLKRYMASILYLVAANTCFWLLWFDGLTGFIVFNIIIGLPLLIYSHQAYKRKESAYNGNLIELLESERQQLSVFLHDEILQDLIALLHTMKSDNEKEKLSSMIEEIRRINQELYPTIVEDLGVDESLKIFFEDIGNDYNVELEYHYEYPSGVLPNKIALAIYRTVKELVINAIKHSCCSQISVLIAAEHDDIICCVTDNGKGFSIPENERLLKSPHMGIYTVKKQLAGLNGNMRIMSDETGSKIQFKIPLR